VGMSSKSAKQCALAWLVSGRDRAGQDSELLDVQCRRVL
jgi:hypothetical protein